MRSMPRLQPALRWPLCIRRRESGRRWIHALPHAKGEMHFLDFREKAPAAASRDMYLDKKGNVTEASQIGYRSAGVPGTVAGLADAERRWGKLGLAK